MNLLIPFILFIFSSTIFLAKNPVYGVLSFVIVIAEIVLLLIALNLEFLAYVLAIVYIGAIVVLFLFVIMMFHIRESKEHRSFLRGCLEYTTLGLLVGSLLAIYSFKGIDEYIDYSTLVSETEFASLLSYLLFNDMALLTIAVTLIMLVGILGTIILTLRETSVDAKVNPSKIRLAIQDTIEQKR